MKTLKERFAYLTTVYPDITQADLARATGAKPPSVHAWFSGDTKTMKVTTAAKAASLYKVNAHWLATGDGEMEPTGSLARVAMGLDSEIRFSAPAAPIELEGNPDFPSIRRVSVKAQAGITGYAVENCEDGAPIVFRADWYKTHNYRPERLMALRVAGESMVPSLWPDDLIVVNTESTTPKDGVAFLVAYYGEVAVKRLVMDAGQWWLSSDNADQRRHPRKLCDDSTVLIGEVVYKQSERV